MTLVASTPWLEQHAFDVEREVVEYVKAEYIVTASGNKVSRKSVLCGSQNIMINGKTIVKEGCLLRGDLNSIKLGRYCVLHENTVIRPPYKKFVKGIAFFPVQLGDNCMVGQGTVICAATIGNCVRFGENCYIGRRSIIKDCVAIDDNSVLPEDSVCPPFSRWAGQPATIVEELPESTEMLLTEDSKDYYEKFIPVGPSGPGWKSATRKLSVISKLNVSGRNVGQAKSPTLPRSPEN